MAIQYKLNRDSAAWSAVFKYNEGIRSALESEGRRLASSMSAKTGEEWESGIRVLAHTQVARVRPISERDDEASAKYKKKRQASAANAAKRAARKRKSK